MVHPRTSGSGIAFARQCLAWAAFLLVTVGIAGSAQPMDGEASPWMKELTDRFPNVRDLAIAPDGSECYFSVQSLRKEFSAILVMRSVRGTWSEPEVAPFSGRFIDIEPAFSPDGRSLYFASTRPLHPDSLAPKDYDIWRVTRTEARNGWGLPERLPEPLNSEKNEFYPSITVNDDVYFTRESDDPKRKEDIFVSRRTGKGYGRPEALNAAVNSELYEFNAFVAPDESYVLFTSYGRSDDLGGGDLYISTRGTDGAWTAARHMGGGANSNRIDYCPFVDARSGLLYFTSERSNVPLMYDRRQDLPALKKSFNRFQRGAGRIYAVPFSPTDPR